MAQNTQENFKENIALPIPRLNSRRVLNEQLFVIQFIHFFLDFLLFPVGA